MPLQATSGAASYDGFGGGVAAVPQYIEDVFSTYLYTGTGATSTQTIINGIDLAGKGGMVWTKSRSVFNSNAIKDTVRGAAYAILPNDTGAQQSAALYQVTAFNSNGFTQGWSGWGENDSGSFSVSWTFRKQPKFFDVVTYTGDGVDGRAISHSLGSVPGCILLKKTSAADDWYVYHRSGGNGTSNGLGVLNSTAAFDTGSNAFGGPGSVSVAPTSTTFTIRNSLNDSGATYVAYLFAHNAGGFGLTGTDNVISCGSYTGTGAVGNKITLGYEPQWLLIKRTDTANSWYLFDTMRGLSLTQSLALLPNGTNSDLDYGSSFQLNADGVTQNNANSAFNASGGTYIYIAIRRGPMKVPTSGTSVFAPALYTGTGSTNTITSPFPSDLLLVPNRAGQFYSPSFWDRLRGATKFLRSPGTDAEATSTDGLTSFGAGQNSVAVGADATYGNINFSGRNYVPYSFRRAPSFFDEVCYTGNNNLGRELNHNLGVTPELIIVKCRNATTDGDASFPAGWWTAVKGSGANGYWFIPSSGGGLNSNNASAYSDTWSSYFSGTTTFNPFYVTLSSGTGISGNVTGQTYVAYLFATCAGVSKVGSYTGNGSSQTINCGFTGGARFVLIKRTSTGGGDWYVWDTARGIVSGNDPHLSLNTTAAEVTTDDTIDPDSTGFIVNQLAATNVNVTSATYIFLAIA